MILIRCWVLLQRAPMIRALCLSVVMLSVSACCGGLHSPEDLDGGTGGGTGGGSGGSGGGATGGGVGGGSTGGGVGGGTGGGTGGGMGGGVGGGTPDAGRNFNLLQFSVLSLPVTGNFGAIVGISGATGDLWAVSDNGHVYHRTDGGFAEMTGFAQSWTDIYVAPDGAVFISGQGRTMRWCKSNCTSAAAFDTFDLTTNASMLHAVCGTSSSDVYAIAGRDSATGILWHYDGTAWTQLSNNLGLNSPRDCYMRPDGVLFISGTRNIVKWEGGAATVETAGLDLSALGADSTTQVWQGLTGVGDVVFAVGDKRRGLVRDPLTSTWSINSNPVATFSTLNAAAFPWPDEGYAAGSVGTNRLLHVSDGGTWLPIAVDLPAITTVYDIHVVNPNELYFGGGDNNGPLIVRGKR